MFVASRAMLGAICLLLLSLLLPIQLLTQISSSTRALEVGASQPAGRPNLILPGWMAGWLEARSEIWELVGGALLGAEQTSERDKKKKKKKKLHSGANFLLSALPHPL